MLGCVVFWPLTASLFHSSHQPMHVRFKRLRPRQWRTRRNALANGSRSSGACFAGEKISMRGDGRIPTADQDIHQRR